MSKDSLPMLRQQVTIVSRQYFNLALTETYDDSYEKAIMFVHWYIVEI